MKQAFKQMFGTGYKVRFRLPVPDCRRALVIAPHPDDETLGCGATIHMMNNANCQVSVVLMTDGKDAGPDGDDSKKRLNEFSNATEALGCTDSILLGFPDGKLGLHISEAVSQLSEILKKQQPEIIFTPYVLDFNPDHRYSDLILSKSISDLKKVHIAMYEVWTPIVYPDCYINVSGGYAAKTSAIKCYESQEAIYSLREKSRVLNDLRATLIARKNVEYIEAFKTMEKDDFLGIIKMMEHNGMF
ncbi:MAG TPA: PIG-L family deacetylase [Ruminiclostridium sp.]|nr:PIG-L family deacetylase [Ruminiclostridium sp.]